MKTKRIIGIDPGTIYTGYGVIEQNASQLFRVHSGRIFLQKEDDLATKLKKIYSTLEQVIKEYRPQEASIEQIFHSINARSSLILGHARGVVFLSCAINNVSIAEYSATQIKSSVTGTGRAEKKQVQFMIRLLLGLVQELPEDESDALAAAICHAHSFSHNRNLTA